MQPSIRWVFYYKRVIAATHSFKFTVFLQNRNCGKITTTIIISPWFQACIYDIISWRQHFQLSIFSMIVSLFHESTWRNAHVKETVRVYFTRLFTTIHYNKRSVVDWRISSRVCLFQESHCGPALLKVPIYSTEVVLIIFFEKYCVKYTKALTEISFFHGEQA